MSPARRAILEAARSTSALALITAAMASKPVKIDIELLRSVARLAAKAARDSARAREYAEVSW